MDRSSRLLLAFVLASGAATAPRVTRLMAAPAAASGNGRQPPQQGTFKPAVAKTSPVPFESYDPQTEEQLLLLANQSRRQAGAPLLRLDQGLSEAARIHASAMLEARQLSHQIDGEPSLPQRLAATTQLLLEQEGENVALDYDAEHGHEHLMLSAPHRANLLNAAYNVVGLGVVRNGDRLYIVQDFGTAVPKYSVAEVKERVAAAVKQTRRQAGHPELRQRNWLGADDVACSMAQADKLSTPSALQSAEIFNVLSFTSLHPDILPAKARRVVDGRALRTFSIGACYGRTETYPTGTYWLVLALE